jgi:hypothetical protein
MAAVIRTEDEAVDRLGQLGLSLEILERVARRAEAEASSCTALDPPIMEGLTRWARTNRFLREELIPLGWNYDNPRNLPRTIHPRGDFAIVAATGDELTGLADVLPTTKYARGEATSRAVEVNEQLTLDFGDFDLASGSGPARGLGGMLTWLMLFHVDEGGFRLELSLPDAIIDGRITSWAERIVLPQFSRDDDGLAALTQPGGDHSGDIVVEVSRR